MLSEDSDPDEPIEDSDPDEPTEEELEEVYSKENTDFTRCIGTEQNGERCIRIRRNGDYCWYHDPENPQICKKCGKKLKVKQEVVVNGRMKNPDGLFEKCNCDAPAPLEIPDAPVIDAVVPDAIVQVVSP